MRSLLSVRYCRRPDLKTEHQKVNECLRAFSDRVIDGRSVSPKTCAALFDDWRWYFPSHSFAACYSSSPPPYIRSRMYTVYIILHTFCLLFSGYVMLYLFSRLGAQSTQARLIRRLCDYIDILLSQIGKVRAMGQSKKRKRKKRGKSI